MEYFPFAPEWRGTPGSPVSLVASSAITLCSPSCSQEAAEPNSGVLHPLLSSWLRVVPPSQRHNWLWCLGPLGKIFSCYFLCKGFVREESEAVQVCFQGFPCKKKWYLMGEWNFRFVEQYYKRNHWAIFLEVEWHFYGPFSTPAFNINGIANTGEKKKAKKSPPVKI